jgi:hypothetical protein
MADVGTVLTTIAAYPVGVATLHFLRWLAPLALPAIFARPAPAQIPAPAVQPGNVLDGEIATLRNAVNQLTATMGTLATQVATLVTQRADDREAVRTAMAEITEARTALAVVKALAEERAQNARDLLLAQRGTK